MQYKKPYIAFFDFCEKAIRKPCFEQHFKHLPKLRPFYLAYNTLCEKITIVFSTPSCKQRCRPF